MNIYDKKGKEVTPHNPAVVKEDRPLEVVNDGDLAIWSVLQDWAHTLCLDGWVTPNTHRVVYASWVNVDGDSEWHKPEWMAVKRPSPPKNVPQVLQGTVLERAYQKASDGEEYKTVEAHLEYDIAPLPKHVAEKAYQKVVSAGSGHWKKVTVYESDDSPFPGGGESREIAVTKDRWVPDEKTQHAAEKAAQEAAEQAEIVRQKWQPILDWIAQERKSAQEAYEAQRKQQEQEKAAQQQKDAEERNNLASHIEDAVLKVAQEFDNQATVSDVSVSSGRFRANVSALGRSRILVSGSASVQDAKKETKDALQRQVEAQTNTQKDERQVVALLAKHGLNRGSLSWEAGHHKGRRQAKADIWNKRKRVCTIVVDDRGIGRVDKRGFTRLHINEAEQMITRNLNL